MPYTTPYTTCERLAKEGLACQAPTGEGGRVRPFMVPMPDEDLRELERRWAEGQGDLGAGEAFSRALERAGADTGRRLEVRLQVLRAHLHAAGLGHLALGPQPELDPMAASFLIPGEDAFRAWHALRARTEASGAYPVIVGAEQEFEAMLEEIAEHPDADAHAVLARASKMEPPTAVAPTTFAEDGWPDEAHPLSELSVTSRDGNVRIALIPTKTPWHAAAFLRFRHRERFHGPEPVLAATEEHVALHRSWYERFGAVPAAVAPDLVEFVVDRPPLTRDASAQLWAEHARFYPGTPWVEDRPERYAACLLGGSMWTLWTR